MKREEIIQALEHVTEKLKEKEVGNFTFTASYSNEETTIGICCPICEYSVPIKIYGKKVKWCPFCGQRIDVN